MLSRSTIFEQEAAVLVRHMVTAVGQLHSAGLAHGTLRPDSFVFADARPQSPLKLADLGLEARCAGWDRRELGALQELCSIVFLHPELLPFSAATQTAPRALALPGPPNDVWSLGCIAYLLMCGYPPFFSPTKRGAIARTRALDYHFDMPYWAKVSDEGKAFVRACLSTSDAGRPTCAEALQLPWVAHLADAAPQGALLPSFMVNLRRFYRMTCIEKYLASVVAELLPDKTDSLRRAFEVADTRGAGWISASALHSMFTREGHADVAAGFAEHYVVPESEGEAYVDYAGVLANAWILRRRKVADAIWSAFATPAGTAPARAVPGILGSPGVLDAAQAAAVPAGALQRAEQKAAVLAGTEQVDFYQLDAWVTEALSG